MKKLLFILLLCSSAFGQQKPMLGVPISSTHPLGTGKGGLVGCWLFNEGSGNIVQDLSRNGNDGTLQADTHFVPGKFGSALDFDGTGDYVDTAYKPIFNSTELTYVIWIYPTALDATADTIVDRSQAGVNMQILNPGKIQVYSGADSYALIVTTAENLITTNKWYQIVFTGKSGRQYIYINGLPIVTDTDAFTNVISDGYRIGLRADSSDYPFTGQIDHTMIYNHALSAGEVALLYREPFCMFVEDDIALMAVEVPSGGQVIFIQMSSIPFIIGLFIFIKRRREENLC